MKQSISVYTKISLVLAVILVGFSIGCSKPIREAMTEEEAKIIMDQYMLAGIKGDMALIDKIIDKKFVLRTPFFPKPLEGIDSYKAMVTNTLNTFSDFNATIEKLVVKDDKIWCRFSMSGVNTGPLGKLPATGKRFKVTGMAITRVNNGKIVEDETYWNVLAFYQQVGFTLVPPQNIEEKKME